MSECTYDSSSSRTAGRGKRCGTWLTWRCRGSDWRRCWHRRPDDRTARTSDFHIADWRMSCTRRMTDTATTGSQILPPPLLASSQPAHANVWAPCRVKTKISVLKLPYYSNSNKNMKQLSAPCWICKRRSRRICLQTDSWHAALTRGRELFVSHALHILITRWTDTVYIRNIHTITMHIMCVSSSAKQNSF